MLQWRVTSFILFSLLVQCIWSRSISRHNARSFQGNPIARSQQVDQRLTCHQAQLSPGCCEWENGNCGVENTCYCDSSCSTYGDCCYDVPEPYECINGSVVTSKEGKTSTTPISTTPTSTTPTSTTPPAPTVLPPTCSAHGLSNGHNGCCEEPECFVELNDGLLCFCDRKCHDSGRNEPCCGDVISNGCYPQTCSQKGITTCCTSNNRTECGVQISQSTTCYCDSSCVASGDCCSDAVQICAQTQAVEDTVEAQMVNFLEGIKKDNYEQMAAAFWRRFNKMNKD